MYDLIARPLQFFYEVWPNYAGAISLLTLSIMLILLPLTLKGTRSMLAMQKLQPELKKLQNKHRDDRQKLNEEVMKFYKENNINPMSGCLPLLLQMPVFFILYKTLYELLYRAPYGRDMGAAVARSVTGVNGGVFSQFGNFEPKHIETTSRLYTDLHAANEMRSFGLNLADSAQNAFSHGLGKAFPYIILVIGVAGTSYYQQRQISGRNQAAQVNSQQQMLMKIMPLFFAFISLTLPAGIVVYFLVSNTFRIGQQALITRTMYRDDDGTVPTSGREIDKSSTANEAPIAQGGLMARLKESLPNPSRAGEGFPASGEAAKKQGSGSKGPIKTKPTGNGGSDQAKKSPNKSAAPSRKAAGPSRAAPAQPNRSRSKKKRK